MKSNPTFILLCLFTLNSGGAIKAQTTFQYDIVLQGGRVIDPETKLDAIKNAGIHNGSIAMISSEPLSGKEIVDVSGLVVAPGFIDLHVHGRRNVEQEYQLHDGVTTALEHEWGIENLKESLLPAKRLEGISPMMRYKGRIQIGADAVITIFDPTIILDKATFEEGLAFSEGSEYVLVNRTFVLMKGETVSNVFQVKGSMGSLKSKFKIKGNIQVFTTGFNSTIFFISKQYEPS